jgi:hypothetical protein
MSYTKTGNRENIFGYKPQARKEEIKYPVANENRTQIIYGSLEEYKIDRLEKRVEKLRAENGDLRIKIRNQAGEITKLQSLKTIRNIIRFRIKNFKKKLMHTIFIINKK